MNEAIYTVMDHPNNAPQDQDVGSAGILIVDEHPENRATLIEILTPCNYRLVEAETAEKSLRRLFAEDFAVLLIDVAMTQMSGFELASVIKKHEPASTVPIIFLITESVDVKQIYKGYRIGAVDYLVKPLIPEVVRAKVAVFVDLYVQKKKLLQQSSLLVEAQRKESELRLMELRLAGERRFRTMADAVPHIIWTANGNGEVNYFNHRWFEYTGISARKASGKWYDALNEDDIEDCRKSWEKSIRTGDFFEKECRLRRGKDGTFRWYLGRAVPELSESGQIISWVGTFTDIDDQKRLQESITGLNDELKRGERLLRLIMNAGPTLISYIDTRCRYILINEVSSQWFGITPEKIRGRHIIEVLGEAAFETIKPFVKRVLSGDIVTYDQELSFVGKESRWVHATYTPDFDEERRVRGFVVHAIDIGELKKTEEKLSREKNFAEMTINSLPGVFYLFDQQGKLLRWNSNLEKVSGYSRQEISKMNPLDFFNKEDRKKIVLSITRIMADGSDTIEARILTRRGNKIPYYFVGFRIFIGGAPHVIGEGVDITDLKEAEEEIRRLSRTNQLILDSAGEGIYGVDTQGTLEFINKSGAQILGYTADELVGKPSHSTWHHHRPEGVLYSQKDCPIFEAYKNARKHSGEDVFWKKDGTKIPVLLSTSPLIEEDEIVGAVVTFTDISERKKAEEALRLSETRFRTLFEQASLSIQILDPVGKSLEVNKSFESLWGLNMVSLKDYNILEDKQLIAKGVMPYIRKGFTGEASEMPVILYDPSETGLKGKPRWVKGYIFPVKNKKGEIIQIVLMHVDVTELTLKENALRESRQQLQAIMDNSPALIYMKDLQGKYMLINQRFEEVFGLDREEVVGKKDEDIFPRETAEILWANDKKVLETGAPIEWEELVPQDDGIHTYISTKYPLLDASGRPYAVCGISTDITERKKNEESLRLYSEELSAANQELEAFSYSASHDLKNPLNTISGFVQILSEDYWESIDETGRDYLKRIALGTGKMRSIIDDLLYFSRIKKLEIRREEVDLTEMADRVISELQDTYPQRRVQVTIQKRLMANADSRMIGIALTNLLNNAWKYTSKKENPKIEVGMLKEDSKTVYFVSDNGAGFDMKLVNRLFVPFQRLHTEKEYTGTGIGLAIVERVIKKHGGRVWAESEVGKGATFYFTLG